MPARPLLSSCHNPTPIREGSRPCGVVSLCQGVASTSGVFFTLGMDSRVHAYSRKHLTPLGTYYKHPRMLTDSFGIGLSLSPCGRWLACGSVHSQSRVYLFDVENATRLWEVRDQGVELRGSIGMAGKLDWNFRELAVSDDTGIISMWHPDVDAYNYCREQPEEASARWGWSHE